MNEELVINIFEESEKLNINNKAHLINYLKKLTEAGAVSCERRANEFDKFNLTILKRPEEFIIVKSGPSSVTKKYSLQNSQANEIKRLSEKVEELTRKLFEVQTAKPMAWLWRVKGNDEWKEATKYPPTADDLRELEFRPLYDYPSILKNDLDIWKHQKSGGDYVVVGQFRWEETNTPAILYRALYDGRVWGRALEVFMDGRFVNVSEQQRREEQDAKESKKRKKSNADA